MKPGRLLTIARSWIGVVAAAAVIASSAFLVAEYVQAARAAAPEKKLVESLQERARTDPTIHKTVLQPEFDRQREALERRLTAYRRGGLFLLISSGCLIAWLNWLRPRPGEWVGVPAAFARLSEAVAENAAERLAALKSLPKRKVKKGALADARPKVADKSQVCYRVLDSCSGCTICAQVCPLNAIEARPYLKHEVIDGKCTRCGLCVPACPEHAIDVVPRGAPTTQHG
jgi:ferredoxin